MWGRADAEEKTMLFSAVGGSNARRPYNRGVVELQLFDLCRFKKITQNPNQSLNTRTCTFISTWPANAVRRVALEKECGGEKGPKSGRQSLREKYAEVFGTYTLQPKTGV